MAGSHRVLVTRAVGLVELTVVLSLQTSGHHRLDAGTDGELDGGTVSDVESAVRRRRPGVVRELGRRRGDG